MFIDEVGVEFRSGAGGDGAATFHREKHVPRGGPNGADGGRGGDVILIADRHARTLYEFRLKPKYQAESGGDARGNKRGKDGANIELRVPVGTVVYDTDTGLPVCDLGHDGMRVVVCKGGKGGKGNVHYTNSIRQAPSFAQKGAPSEELSARLELKLLADVGLVGLPNAGKSTLLSRLTAAKPKIADYPFTTIVPNLGVVQTRDSTFVMADLPGLIEGAAEGQGLGHRFLRHVERTKVLVHLVDCAPLDESDPIENYKTVVRELEDYDVALADRETIVALNKIDLISEDQILRTMGALAEASGAQVFPISGVSGKGLAELLDAVLAALVRAEATRPVPIVSPIGFEPDSGEDEWDVRIREDGFEVEGKRIVRMVAMTNLENEDALSHLHRRLERMGVIQRLRDAGATEGDDVFIGDFEFAFTDRPARSVRS